MKSPDEIMQAFKSEHPMTDKEAFEWHTPNVPEYKPEQWLINELNMRIEYALRHLVNPPIKGEITRGKIRWRGIYAHTLVCEGWEVYNVRISGDGKLTDIRFAGHSLGWTGRHYFNELYLYQRDHAINLEFEGEELERYKEFRSKHELG